MSRRELAALLIACALHVGLLRVAELLPGGNLLFDRAAAQGDSIEIEIEPKEVREPTRLATRETDPEPKERSVETPEPAKAEAGAVATTPHSGAPDASDRDAEDEAPANEPPASSSEGSQESAALPAPGSPDEYGPPPEPGPAPGPIGPNVPPIWAGPGGLDIGPGPAAPTRAPAARPVDPSAASSVVASTLRDADRAAGITMPSTSVVSSAVSVAARSVSVPHNTRATFEVKLGPGGTVLSSRVVKHSGGDKAQWDAAAKSVAASLAGRSLDIGQAKSATVLVNVTAKHVFPAGTAKAADVKPVCANQIINDLADGLDKNPDKNPEPNVPLFQDENGRPCIPIGVAGISDAANIGAQKQIQIQTSSTVLIDGKAALPANISKVNKDPFWVDTGKAGPRPVMPFKMRKYKRDKEKKN